MNYRYSSSSGCPQFSPKQQDILRVLAEAKGELAMSEIAARINNRVQGSDMLAIQVLVRESGMGKFTRRQDGRFMLFEYQPR